jgi:hypothetical protein
VHFNSKTTNFETGQKAPVKSVFYNRAPFFCVEAEVLDAVVGYLESEWDQRGYACQRFRANKQASIER